MNKIKRILRFIKYNITDFFRSLIRSFQYARFGWNDFDFDGGSIYNILEMKLKHMRKYFSTAHIISAECYENYIRDIDICLNLIKIITGEMQYVEYIFNGTIEHNYHQIKYVNTRNAYRFVKYHERFKDKNDKFAVMLKEDLAETKARHLLFMILDYKLDTWWD